MSEYELDLASVWAAPAPKIDFVLPGLAIGTVGLVVGTGGAGKTFAMLATALGIAVGRDVGDLWGDFRGAGHAVFISLEDPEEVLRSRLHALRSHLRDDEQEAACARLHVHSCAGHNLTLANLKHGKPVRSGWLQEIEKHLAAVGARLCVVDTFNRALGGVSENDSGAMGLVIGEIERAAREARCAIVLCHHVSKQALTLSSAGDAHAARGSSVITDNARWQCNLTTPTEVDRRFKDTAEAARRSFVQLSFSKTNYGPPLPPRWLHRAADGVLSHRGDVAESVPKANARRKGALAPAAEPARRPVPSRKQRGGASSGAEARSRHSFEGEKEMRIA